METIAGLATTGRCAHGPGSDLVEVVDQNGFRQTAIVFHAEYRDHPSINSALAVVQNFLESPMVTGLCELAAHDAKAGGFVYPTGQCWSVAEVIRACADLGEVPGIRAGLELMHAAGSILCEASDLGQAHGLYSHGGLSPWRIMAKADGQTQVVGYGLPQVEILHFLDHPEAVPREDSFRYCPPERLDRANESLSTDLFTLALIAFELMTGKPVYDGLVNDIRAMASRAEGSRRLFRFREQLPGRVMELLKVCLRLDPKDRFPDGASFLRAVSQSLTSGDGGGPSLMDVMARVANLEQRTGMPLEGGKTLMVDKADLNALLGGAATANGSTSTAPAPARVPSASPAPASAQPPPAPDAARAPASRAVPVQIASPAVQPTPSARAVPVQTESPTALPSPQVAVRRLPPRMQSQLDRGEGSPPESLEAAPSPLDAALAGRRGPVAGPDRWHRPSEKRAPPQPVDEVLGGAAPVAPVALGPHDAGALRQPGDGAAVESPIEDQFLERPRPGGRYAASLAESILAGASRPPPRREALPSSPTAELDGAPGPVSEAPPAPPPARVAAPLPAPPPARAAPPSPAPPPARTATPSQARPVAPSPEPVPQAAAAPAPVPEVDAVTVSAPTAETPLVPSAPDDAIGEESAEYSFRLGAGEPFRVRLPFKVTTAHAAGLLIGSVLPLRTDLRGCIAGWYRLALDGAQLPPDAPMSSFDPGSILEIAIVENQLVDAQIEVRSGAAPILLRTPVGSAVPAAALAGAMASLLGLPEGEWRLKLNSRALEPFEILRDFSPVPPLCIVLEHAT
jgi:hypothetical protein